LYKIKISNGIDQISFEWWAREYDIFPEIYIEKEQIAGAKIDQGMRKIPGHGPWDKAFFFMCKEDPLKLYKIEFATELIKCFLNDGLENMMFFPIFTQKKNNRRCQK
jgi:hypothetical protein